MSRSIKAALLSALLFPGTGHLYLRRYIRGGLLALGSAALFFFLLSVALSSAFVVVEEIQRGDIPLDVQSIAQSISSQSQGQEESTNLATSVLIALWVVGIADSYREGRAQEKAGEKKAKTRKGTA